jgi:hypothetical protein
LFFEGNNTGDVPQGEIFYNLLSLRKSIRSYRVCPDGTSSQVVGDVVLSTTLLPDQRLGADTGTEAEVDETGVNGLRAAEKSGGYA